MIGWRIFRSVSASHFRTDALKTLFTVIGMALGVAVFFAIQTANQNAWTSFVSSAKLIAPDSAFRIVAPSGEVPESVVVKLLSLPGVAAVSPQSSVYATAYSDDTALGVINVVGIDLIGAPEVTRRQSKQIGEAPDIDVMKLLRDPRAVLVSQGLNQELRGGALSILSNGAKVSLTVAAVLPEDGIANAFGGRTAVLDIGSFQELFGRYGRVDSLTLTVGPSVSREALARELTAIEPEQVSLADADENTRHAAKMSESFRLNLSFLAGVSLFIALFLIYNTTNYAVLKRRTELSTLRSIGASSKDILVYLCLENIVVGFVSAVAGVGLGAVLALGAVKLVSTSFSSLYVPIAVSQVHYSPQLIAWCLCIGPIISLAGGIGPILEVARLSPTQTRTYQQAEAVFRSSLLRSTAIGVAMLVLCALSARTQVMQYSIYAGFLSPAFLLIGFSFLVPLLVRAAVASAEVIAHRLQSIELMLALDHVRSTLRRNAVAVSAMAIAIGMFVGMTVMILSFRQTVVDWVTHITRADVYISTASRVSGSPDGYLPEEFVEFLMRHPGVRDFDWVSTKKVRFADREVKVTGVRFELLGQYDRLLLETPMPPEALRSLAARTDIVLASETFAARNGVTAGAEIELPGFTRKARLQIANVFYDYSSDQGALFIPDALFVELFGESRKQGVSLYLAPGVTADQIRDELAKKFPAVLVSVRSNSMLRQLVLDVFDDTFKITYALQGIALLISALTIINTVLMLILERRQEFATLRAIGASRWSLARMIGYESLFLGAVSAAGGVLLGFALATILVFVVNKFFFGWSIRFVVPAGMLLGTVGSVLLMTLAAGLIPGLKTADRLSSKALRYE